MPDSDGGCPTAGPGQDIAAAHSPGGLLAPHRSHRPTCCQCSHNNFAAWCLFGNDPDEQEKIVKFSTLLTNCVVFHATVDMMAVLQDPIAEGRTITAADLVVLSPYLTARIQGLGVYATDKLALTPDAYDARLGVELDLPAPDHLAPRATE
jgi:hypothetical protein